KLLLTMLRLHHPAGEDCNQQLDAVEQTAAGVSDDLIRVSVGIEHIDDIIADFTQAFGALDQVHAVAS
ncbi:MAG: hypothetical protein GWP18_06995, partial [Proteobacteria bacterium]|nr:hypothetical protein [Pseudomonadota bacterium]